MSIQWPTNSQFTAYLKNGQPITDPLGDIFPKAVDIVGTPQFPAVFFAFDGTTIFFRLRLAGSPLQGSGFENFAWGLLINTNGDPATFQWRIAVNGLNARVELRKNISVTPNQIIAPAELLVASFPVQNYNIARGITANSNISGTGDFFIDFQIPFAVLQANLGITANSTLRFIFFTSASNEVVNRDIMGGDPTTLTAAYGDNTTLDQGSLLGKLAAQKTFTGPVSLTLGNDGSWNVTVTVSNTGKADVNNIILQDLITLDAVIALPVPAVSNGVVVFEPLNNSIHWTIGTLTPGQTATMTFAVSGFFVSGISRTINSATVTGVESVTGGALAVGPITGPIINIGATVGGIAGTVADSVTGLGLSGVNLTLTQGATVIATTSTHSDGTYSFDNLASGSYTVTASFPNYIGASAPLGVTAGNTSIQNFNLEPAAGNINGTVIDAISQTGIAGAAVSLRDVSHNIIAATTTDANGAFSFTNLAVGTYILTASAAGFGAEQTGAVIAAGQTVTARISLQPQAGTVSGKVSGQATGAGIPGASVEIRQNGLLVAATTADANGNYAITGLAPGTYTISAAAANFAQQNQGVTVESNQTTIADFSLTANPGNITGRITNVQTDAPIPNATVKLYIGNTLEAITSADAAGVYNFSGLPPGAYQVVAFGDGFSQNTAGVIVNSNQTSTADLALAPTPGSITGQVTDILTGAAIAGATVNLYDLFNNPLRTVSADDNGRYQILDVAPGTYEVVAAAANFGAAAAGAIVNSNTVTQTNLALQPNPATVSGTVIDSQTGQPLVGAAVNVYDTSGDIITTVLSGQNGNYVILGLAPGSYNISVAANDFGVQIKGVNLTSGGSETLNFSLNPLPGSIGGTVTDLDTGLPISGAFVILSTNRGVFVDSLLTDKNGNYSFNNLAPGVYDVISQAEGFGQDLKSTAVNSGAESILDFQLSTITGVITGRVFDVQTGSGISGAGVTVSLINSLGVPVATGVTDNNGNFSFPNIKPGSYTVTAAALNFGAGSQAAIVDPGVVTAVNIGLSPDNGSVTGQITNILTGVPIAGATVSIIQNNVIFGTAVTNDQGIYQVNGLAPGKYRVEVFADNFSQNSEGVFIVSNVLSQVNLGLDPNPGSIGGTVTAGDTGLPLSGVLITLIDQISLLFASTLTDDQGRYLFQNIAPGIYKLVFTKENFSSNEAGANVISGRQAVVDLSLNANPGALTGVVADVVTGLPIPGANIKIFTETGTLIAVLGTDSAGRYQITDLAPGSYNIVVAAPGFANFDQGAIISSGVTTVENIALFSVFSTLTGTVTDAVSGLPIARALVTLFDESGTLVGRSLTDRNGNYLITNLAPGTFLTVISANGFGRDNQNITLAADQDNVVNFSLRPNPGSLVGTVVDTGGAPIVGATLQVYNNVGIFLTVALSDGQGRYSIPNLAPAVYRIVATAPGFGQKVEGAVVQTAQETVTDFVLTSGNGAIMGNVQNRDTGAALAGVVIDLFDSFGRFLFSVLTDSAGFFLLDNLAPDSYRIFAHTAGFSITGLEVNVTVGVTSEVTILLATLTGMITGTVTSLTTGAPLPGTLVKVNDRNNLLVDTRLTDQNGNYTSVALAPDSYYVTAQTPGFASQVQAAGVNAGVVTRADFSLGVLFGNIIGAVTDQNGNPLVGVVVRAIANTGALIARAISEADGTYLLSQLPPDTYTVIFTLEQLSFTAADITLTVGVTKTVNARLTPNFGNISVNVNDPFGNPIPGAVITIWRNNQEIIRNGLTTVNGAFLVQGLAPGTYVVTATLINFGARAGTARVNVGQTANIHLVLPVASGGVRGRIISAVTGLALANAIILMFDSNGNAIARTLSDVNGNYLILNLAPGNYTLTVSAPGFIVSKQSVTIIDGSIIDLNISLTVQPAPGRFILTEVEVLVAEAEKQFLLENRFTLSNAPVKIKKVDVRIDNVQLALIVAKGIIQGRVDYRIFFIDQNGNLIHNQFNAMFSQFVELTGAVPGLNTSVQSVVEDVLFKSTGDIVKIISTMRIHIKVTRTEELQVLASQ